jgi:shikimate kinase
MNTDTRAAVRRNGVSVWLKADYEILLRRVRRRSDRPMLKTADPAETLRRLMAERDPVYGEADLTIESRDVSHDTIVTEAIAALASRLGTAAPCNARPLPESAT